MLKYGSFWYLLDFLAHPPGTSHSSSSRSRKRDSNASSMDIGTPYNTIHVTHVGFDPATGEFTGLPREWQILLNQSGITTSEQRQNPQVDSILKPSLMFSLQLVLLLF